HTRWPRDWSSDVCSSDLTIPWAPILQSKPSLFHLLVMEPQPRLCSSLVSHSAKSRWAPLQSKPPRRLAALRQSDTAGRQRLSIPDRKSVVEGKSGDLGGA